MFDECKNATILVRRGGKIDTVFGQINYDKIENKFLFSEDCKVFSFLSMDSIKDIIIDKKESKDVYVNNSLLSDKFFVKELISNKNKYSLFGHINCRLIKSNYTNNGLVESGKNYDEYLDEYIYMIVLPDGKTVKKVKLKKAIILKALEVEKVRVNKYLDENNQSLFDEKYLICLIKYLN